MNDDAENGVPSIEGLDRNLIDGKLVASASGETFETINPATEQVLGVAADGNSSDMDAAIDAARRAFDRGEWSADPNFRAHCLRQLRRELQTNGDDLRALTTAEVGAPVFLTGMAQFDTPVDDLGYFADLAESYPWSTDMGDATSAGIPSHRTLWRESAGVVGAITPWNFPYQINLAKIGPALAAGCTVVLKPAPDTPWAAAALGAMASRTDLPPGVLNIVNSSDHQLGSMLSSDPRIDLISFTGSTDTGRKIMAAAAPGLKRLFLELGGKSAFVILDDADVAAATGLAAFMVCTHAGQGCAIATRLVVPRSRYDEVVDATAAAMEGLGFGDPTQPGTICGPLISERQRERVESYLRLAIDEGGSFATGGGRPAGMDRGFFIEPTLVTGLDNSARVAREEIFGPVLTVIAHDGDDDAIRIANDSPYGLSGAVYSADRDRAMRAARAVRTGTMSVNGGMWYSADVPFGGYKASGIGREMGVAGMEEYLETKVIAEAI